ncbi:hypothetical protein MHK_005407 [Candidatus Magnetomorum sp. HK-1]|nr:hypothetical protein MHK_005407 [Candidatus Magnetomorum sp. HK-1]
MKQNHLIFIFVLISMIGIFVFNDMNFSHASSSFDPDDTSFDQEDSAFFDSDDDASLFDDETQFSEEKIEESNFQSKILKDSKFTFGYEFSFGINLKPEFITNDVYIRHELQTLLSDKLFFQFDANIRGFFNDDHRASAKKKDFLAKSNIREFFIQTSFENFSVTLGKKIIVWGKADTGIITDVVSPRDNSEFIFIKLEDARFGQPILSTDFYTQYGSLFFFISLKPLTDKEPDENTRYYIAFPEMNLIVIENENLTYSDIEYGSRWQKSIGKTDLSLMAGKFYDNTGIYSFSKRFHFTGKPIFSKSFHTYEMIGMAASYAMDKYLFKIETAYKNNLVLQGLNFTKLLFAEKKDILDMSFGMEYNDNDKYQIYLEISNRYIPGNLASLSHMEKNNTSCYFTFTKEFLNQTLNIEYMFYYHIQEKNAFNHVRLSRDVTDNFQIITSCAFLDIQDETSLMWFYKDEHRLTVDIKYYF